MSESGIVTARQLKERTRESISRQKDALLQQLGDDIEREARIIVLSTILPEAIIAANQGKTGLSIELSEGLVGSPTKHQSQNKLLYAMRLILEGEGGYKTSVHIHPLKGQYFLFEMHWSGAS